MAAIVLIGGTTSAPMVGTARGGRCAGGDGSAGAGAQRRCVGDAARLDTEVEEVRHVVAPLPLGARLLVVDVDAAAAGARRPPR
ncbi:MAG: hypothetical protein WDN04_11835 [Rhodospirillales bacterium]